MELAEQVYNQTKIKYEAGVGDNIEINAAQLTSKPLKPIISVHCMTRSSRGLII